MQEHGPRLDVLSRMQRKVEPICVADDDRAVWVLLGGSRVKTEVSRIELPAAPFVANWQPEMIELAPRAADRSVVSAFRTDFAPSNTNARPSPMAAFRV
jgi:hypothetical protein